MDHHIPLAPLPTSVLTLLAEHPMHPYEATYHFRVRHVKDYVKVRTGSLYHAFEQLHRRGLIEPAEVWREGRRPERTVYRITETGRAVLEESVARLISEPVNEYTAFEAGLVNLPHLPKSEVVRLLRERAIRVRARAIQHQTMLQGNLEDGLPLLFQLEVDSQIDSCTSQAAWCDRTADAIDRGDIPWPTRRDLERLTNTRRPPEPGVAEESARARDGVAQ